MPTKSIKIDSVWKKAALAAIAVICVVAAGIYTKWGLAATAADRTADVEGAIFLTQLAPDDPQIHYLTAFLLEKRYGPGDDVRSLQEYETATALSPTNYLMWLELGRARERSGDPTRSELALRKALELAPNYARVQWALGNNLLRQGRTEEAFAEINKAVNADPATYSGPAIVSGRQFLGDDVAEIQRRIAGPIEFKAALTSMLIGEKRFDEAMALWNTFPVEQKRTKMRDTGNSLLNHLLEVKKFREAAALTGELAEGDPPLVGQINNGGFESAVKPTGAGVFEWNISPGLLPQIVLSSGQKHSGNASLLIVFNTKDGKDFRTVSQVIAVEPNKSYELQMFVRFDLKTSAVFKWEVLDASDGHQLAVSDAFANGANWVPIILKFKTPATADGIVIRLARENCGQICAVNGTIGIDDVSLRSVDQ